MEFGEEFHTLYTAYDDDNLHPMMIRRWEILVGIAISAIAFIVYVMTVCPTVNFIDSGELATDVYTLGIAHPTGYPIFVLIGYLFSHLPLGLRPIYQINLMAAVFCSVALFVFFRFLVFLLETQIQEDKKKNDPKNPKDHFLSILVPSAVGTLVLAFSETFWSQALAVEVYSLHLLFVSAILFLFTKALFDSKEHPGKAYWFGFAFVLGLAFTNHGTTILLAPAFLIAFFLRFDVRNGHTWKHLLRLAVPFLIGFSAILYLPVRASSQPLMNWGNPSDLFHFWYHISGGVYHVWMFSSWESAGKQFQYFLNSLPSEFAYVPLLIAAIGIWTLFKRSRQLLIFTMLLFWGCIGYAINYDIHDIDSYFLLAYLTVAMWCAVGSYRLISSVRKEQYRLGVAALLIALTSIEVWYHYSDVDERHTTIVENYTKDMLASVEPNGIIISYQWDYFVSAAYYFQIIEHVRPDVTIVDKELLRRMWYLQQLESRYPELLRGAKHELEAYRNELYKFEHNLPYDRQLIEYRYNSFIHSIIEKNFSSRPVYVSQEIEPQYTSGYQRIPSGLAFRLTADQGYREIHTPEFHLYLPEKATKYTDAIVDMYVQSYFNMGTYQHIFGRETEALRCIDSALAIQPSFQEAILLKKRIRQQ